MLCGSCQRFKVINSSQCQTMIPSQLSPRTHDCLDYCKQLRWEQPNAKLGTEQNRTELELRVGKYYIGGTSVYLMVRCLSGVFSLSTCVCVQCHLTLQRMETISRSMREKLREYIKGYQEINVNICEA